MSRKNGWKKQCAVWMVCAISLLPAAAQTFTTLHSFTGREGANPYAGLVQGPDGNLYGTTTDGGAFGGGNVVQITPFGEVRSIYDFCAQSNCADGQYPVSTLVVGPDGELYGTTQNGGTYNWGSIFKVSTQGALTTLHSFDISDGVSPYGALLLASNGNLYGTANAAGACTTENAGCGTVFVVSPSGKFKTLHNFCLQTGCPDGEFPVGGLVEASDGYLYGTTNAGGNSICPGGGCGTVYRITPGGKFTSLHRFDNADGAYPPPSLVELRKGVFYGTTAGGGADGDGTVFSITADGSVTTLHSFNGVDGFSPFVLAAGSDGNVYGTTLGGGTAEAGTIFKLTPDGTLSTLYSFAEHFYYYFGALTQETNGSFYGTTYFGGSDDDGTIYNLATGLTPFVKAQPSAGKAGSTASILGNNLSQATGVAFNGTPATFQVISKTLIMATVPAGASSGKVSVTGPGYDLRSNVPFWVRP